MISAGIFLLPGVAYSHIGPAIIVMINLLSTEAAAMLQRIMVFFLLAIMLAYMALGVGKIEVTQYSPFFFENIGWRDVFIEAGFIFVSFGGLMGVVSVAEEVENPRRSLPFGILWTLGIVTFFYVSVMVVTVGAIPPSDLIGSQTPLADPPAVIAEI